jgi:roadblock/LC7 domain-containing protein
MLWIDGEYFEDQCATAKLDRALRVTKMHSDFASAIVKMMQDTPVEAWELMGEIIKGQFQINAMETSKIYPFPHWKYSGGSFVVPVSGDAGTVETNTKEEYNKP